MKTRKLIAVALAAFSLMLLTSCTLVKFENPGDQQKKQDDAAKLEQVAQRVDPADMLLDDRLIARQLNTSSGLVLASYSVRLPRFDQDGAQSATFERINSVYALELAALQEDCESFFMSVKRDYGDEWESVSTIEGSAGSAVWSYEIMKPPPQYICVEKLYTYTDSSGRQYKYYYPDVFLAETGWRLTFDDLFGSNSTQAENLLGTLLDEWCAELGIKHEKLPSLPLRTFTDNFAIDGSNLIFYSEPFELSTDDPSGYEIKLPLSGFEEYLIG